MRVTTDSNGSEVLDDAHEEDSSSTCGSAATPVPKSQFKVRPSNFGRGQQPTRVGASFRPALEEATPPAQPVELRDQRRLENGKMVMFLQRLPTCEDNALTPPTQG